MNHFAHTRRLPAAIQMGIVRPGTCRRLVSYREWPTRNTFAILRNGVAAWNQYRTHETSDPDLQDADLSGLDLSWANLGRTDADPNAADLSGANLRGATLTNAYLGWANLRGATLIQANLSLANLSDVNLAGADLTGADLFHANFSSADLGRADLTKARLFNTVLANTDLSHARGLDSCHHGAPSAIDYRTLARSGHLPLAFLRGCGLPEKLIEYLPSLLNEAIHFYSCFISYSTKDETFAQRFHADLQNKGVRCWFAPHDIRSGKKIHEQIDEAIHIYDRLLLVLSEHSMNSEWVMTEIAKARKRELRENRRMLFPVRLVGFDTPRDWECFDADTGKDSAREIREYFIPDFSNWNDFDSYQKAFQRFLSDLKTETGPQTSA